MVRATYARVLVRTGGSLPTGFTEASVTAMCTQADYIGDAFTYPDSLSTTDNAVLETFVDIVLNMMEEKLWFHAGGTLSGQPRPVILTEEIKERLKHLQTDTEFDGFTYVKMQESD